MRFLLAFCLAVAAAQADILINNCDDAARWKGATGFETRNVKEGKGALQWQCTKSTSLILREVPHDWSAGSALAFWVHSSQSTGSPFWIIVSSENPASEGSDYFVVSSKTDFTGWKRFVIPFEEMGRARQPAGWNKINGLTLHAAWDRNVAPDPKTVLLVDDIRLVQVAATGQGPRMTDAEFWAALNLELPELARIKEAVAQNDSPGAGKALAEYLRKRKLPTWLKDFRSRPAPNPKFKTAAADKLLDHEFTFIKTTYKPKGRIDWSFNAMTEGESATVEWNAQFNRHFHFEKLADAYWHTGQEKYAAEIAAQMTAWAEDCPVLLWRSGNSPYHHAWETLNTGVRISNTWPDAFFRCLDSPSFTPERIVKILKSWHEQAEHLMRWPTQNNWLTCESCGVFFAGILFPEFKRAADWRRTAIERLYRQLDHEVYPDGLQVELALGYNNWVLQEFSSVLEVARHNGRTDAVPADFQAKIEKMYNYQLYAMRPDGVVWGLNDAGDTPPRRLFEQAASYFPKRQDFKWAATGGKEGTEPSPASMAMDYSGHFVLRGGWNPDDLHLLFDAGPFGAGHQHEDKLGVLAYAFGKPLLVEGGVYMYDKSRWRRYVLSTRAHNTVRVDGLDQNSRGSKESFVLPYPFAPLKNPWFSSPEADFTEGSYEYGYRGENGKTADVRHRRAVVFVKPNYWIVSDVLTPKDGIPHRYEAQFHLNATDAKVEGLAVHTTDPAANLHLLAAPSDGLSLRVVKGLEEEPVQGWANQPWRPVPTALAEWQAAGVTRRVFLLHPSPAGGPCPVKALTPLAMTTDKGESAPGIALRIDFQDGSAHLFCHADPGAGICRFGGWETDARCAVIELDPSGQPVRQIACLGKRLERK